MIGTVRGSESKKNRDGDHKVLLLKVEMTDNKDIQTIELMSQSGEDYKPLVGSKVFIVKMGEAWKLAIACDDGIEPMADDGERILYALGPGGAIATKLHFKKGGEAVFDDGTDYAVAYEDLKTAFDQLKSDVDALVTLYGTLGPPLTGHIHTGVTIGSGSTGPPTALASKSTADITPSKVLTVRFP